METTHVVLFSGGMDSTTALNHVVKKYGPDDVIALNISYGSNHNVAERMAAEEIVRRLGVKAYGINLPKKIFEGSGSALMGEQEVPDGSYRPSGPQETVVSFRNGTFISVATAFAGRFGKAEIWIGNHADDAAGWAYPDCTPEFMAAMAEAVHVASMGEIRLITPFQWKDKAEIVTMAAEEGAPLELSYSCYRGTEIHCGKCATCIDRNQAFVRAGFKDPTVYTNGIEHEHLDLQEWSNG